MKVVKVQDLELNKNKLMTKNAGACGKEYWVSRQNDVYLSSENSKTSTLKMHLWHNCRYKNPIHNYVQDADVKSATDRQQLAALLIQVHEQQQDAVMKQ